MSNDAKAAAIHFTPAGAEKMRARLLARSEMQGDCRVWVGGRERNGYGVTGGALTGRSCRLYTHRAAWAAWNDGYLPAGVVVRHACDNPPCVNPDHLLTGSTSDNNFDTSRRGHYPVKLTEDGVRQIRRRSGEGETLASIGRDFGITVQSTWQVVHRRTWRHVE